MTPRTKKITEAITALDQAINGIGQERLSHEELDNIKGRVNRIVVHGRRTRIERSELKVVAG